jgi:hypothetical protein
MEGWDLLPQALYKEIIDVVLTESKDTIIKIASKCVLTPVVQPNAAAIA